MSARLLRAEPARERRQMQIRLVPGCCSAVITVSVIQT